MAEGDGGKRTSPHFPTFCAVSSIDTQNVEGQEGNPGDSSKHRQVTDLNVTDLGFLGPRIPFCATGALWGRVTPFFDHFPKHLSIVLGRTELCHEVRNPAPQKPQIIRNENHHLALLDSYLHPFREEAKGQFRKRVFLANVPSFRFLAPGNIRRYRLLLRGTSA